MSNFPVIILTLDVDRSSIIYVGWDDLSLKKYESKIYTYYS